jgi:hypothetical protein
MVEYEGTTTRCCLCGKVIPTWGSKNPDPLRSDSDQRCCDECFTEKVIPARQVMVGQREEKMKKITVSLSEEFELWKLERIRDSFNAELGEESYSLEDVAQILLSDAIIEKVRTL